MVVWFWGVFNNFFKQNMFPICNVSVGAFVSR